jgi:hypothetical protein
VDKRVVAAIVANGLTALTYSQAGVSFTGLWTSQGRLDRQGWWSSLLMDVAEYG